MKRANRLFHRIPTQENLRKAFRKAAKGKRRKQSVIDFAADFDNNIQKLQHQIVSGQPDIGHYRFFTVHDPKSRVICAASFPERVLHHAVMNVCEPSLDKQAIFDSYACRKGKGNRRALQRAQTFARKYPWHLKLDIRKYFDAIDHAVAMRLLTRVFKERDLLFLFEEIIDSYHAQPGKGVPIGNLISQHLANFYLGPLDRHIKETRRIKGYVRYMDDFILFAREQAVLKTELDNIRSFLKSELDLTLKGDIRLNRSRFGIPFLGFRIFPAHIRLNSRSRRRFPQKLREYERNFLTGAWNGKDLIRHVGPLTEFTNAGDSRPFRRSVIQRFAKVSDL
jgi:retron-type reverse transcriptase